MCHYCKKVYFNLKTPEITYLLENKSHLNITRIMFVIVMSHFVITFRIKYTDTIKLNVYKYSKHKKKSPQSTKIFQIEWYTKT